MRCQYSRVLIGFVSMLSIAAIATADEKSAEEFLKERGLRRLSSCFSLPEESELGAKVRDAEPLKKKVRDTQPQVEMWEKRVEDKKKLIVACLQKRRELRAQLSRARSPDIHNRIVLAINELADRVLLLEKAGVEENSLKAAREEANKASEEYVEHLFQTRKLSDKVKEAYEDLAADTKVKEAIEEYSKATGKAYKLGPTTSFLSYGRRLKKLEDTVLSDSIDLRQDQGRLWHVRVMFDGKYARELSVDTGASVICLPWQMAKEVGLTPSPEDPTVRLKLADGRIVEGKRVFAQTVRVGKFTVEHVECAVFPEELTEAAAALGQSFLKHFTYRIDTVGSKLIMSKVETSTAGKSRW